MSRRDGSLWPLGAVLVLLSAMLWEVHSPFDASVRAETQPDRAAEFPVQAIANLAFAQLPRSRYVEDMTMEAIKEAITHLTEQERRQLTEWFDEFKEEEWDRQIKNGFSPGRRGIAWGERVKADIAAGNFTSLAEGLRRRRDLRAKR